MQIGLIGGIGPAATDYYYQRIIRAFEAAERPLELTTVHASSSTLLKNLAKNSVEEQVAIYERLTKRLAAAGAGCVVVTSIAGHFCIEPFKKISPLPVIDMIEETGKAVGKLGYERIGILGTRTVMQTRFYGGITSAEIIPPEGHQLDAVHEAYVTMAAAGTVNNQQREVFAEACKTLLEERKADAILLGGTDLALVYQEGSTGFPIIDCAAIHCDAVVKWALG
ncbi:MAG: amino acid racemase [Pseudomonadota bacterium]